MKMSRAYGIGSITRTTPLLQTLNTISLRKVTGIRGKSIHHSPSKMMMSADPSDQPGDFRTELPDADAASPVNPDRDLPSGVTWTPYNVPDFDPIPPEKPADPPPVSPIGPEFPGPPNPSPPKPEAPRPPAPSPPCQPEVFPHHGHGPDSIPSSKPPEPGAPNPTQPDIPVPR